MLNLNCNLCGIYLNVSCHLCLVPIIGNHDTFIPPPTFLVDLSGNYYFYVEHTPLSLKRKALSPTVRIET